MQVPTPLGFERVRYQPDLSSLGLKTSDDVTAAPAMIGQAKALQALQTGLNIPFPGFNVYLSGPRGSGRFAAVRELLRRGSARCGNPRSYAYVHNFKDGEHPYLVTLPPGKGRAFQKAVDHLRQCIKDEVPALLSSEIMTRSRKRMQDKYELETKALFGEFEERVTTKGFALAQGQTPTGTVHIADIVPVIEGEAVPMEHLKAGVTGHEVDEETVSSLEAERAALRAELTTLVTEHRKLTDRYRELMSESERRKLGEAIEPLFSAVRSNFASFDVDVAPWLGGLKAELLDSLEYFRESHDNPGQEREQNMAAFLWFVRANLLRDPKDEDSEEEQEGCTVVEEAFPTWRNLFGVVESSNDPPMPTFMDIRPGSLLNADGGFLVLYARDVVSDPAVYETLKRILRKGEIEITNDARSNSPAVSLKPEPLPVSVRVVLVGDGRTYSLLHRLDPDFSTIFKIKVELEEDMPLNDETLADYLTVLRRIIDENKLPPFDRAAMESLVEEGVRLAGSRKEISTRFSQIADCMREATFIATERGSKLVEREDQDKALDQRAMRHGQAERHMLEMVRDGKLLIDTDGLEIGQINGLGYYSVSDASFGLPARISATCSPGRQGVVNIEREADLSGRIHDKGVLLINGFLASRFAQTKPLSLHANLAFEQSYGPVDGDSASVAELLALLSALSGVPIRQDLAITGSLNQRGQVQPVGGVSEKTLGFFRTCQMSGLTGTQGVLLPAQTIDELQLDRPATKAIEEGQFHIYAISCIEEAIALMMTIDPEEVLEKADVTLTRYAEIVRDFN